MRFRLAAIWRLVLFLVLASSPALAEDMPDERPFLRIEAGLHTGTIKRIGVSADGRLLATASYDKTVRLWDLPSGTLTRVFRLPLGDGDDGKIYAGALSPDGRLLAAGGWDAHWRDHAQPIEMFVYVYDTRSGKLAARLGPLPEVIFDLAFSPDGQWLATGLANSNGIRLWSVEAGLSGTGWADRDYAAAVYGIDFDRRGHMVTTSYDGFVRRYGLPAPEAEPGDLQPALKRKAPGGDAPYGIAFSPDGRRLALGYSGQPMISLLDGASLRPLAGKHVDTSFALDGDFASVAWSADGEQLFGSGSYDDGTGTNPVMVWGDGGAGAPRALDGPLDTILDLASLPDGGVAWAAGDTSLGAFPGEGENVLKLLPVQADMRDKRSEYFWASGDGAAVRFGLQNFAGDPWVFDTQQLTFVASPEIPEGFINAITDRLKVENWINDEAPTLDGQKLGIDEFETSRSLAIAPDGQSFFIGSEWSIYQFDAQGKQLQRLVVPAIAWGVNLSADGTILIVAYGDGTIRWYEAATGKELLAFFAHVPDKRWVAWTPSGYYAASPGGEDLIGWHLNGKTWDDPVEFYGASRFRERFYRPDIVKLVLRTRDEATAVAEANAAGSRKIEDLFEAKDLPPVIEIIADPRGIETEQEDVELHYRVRTPSGRKVTKAHHAADGIRQ